MATYSITDFAAAIPSRLRDDANKLVPVAADGTPQSDQLESVLEDFALRAIVRYSKDKPLQRVSDVVSEGGNTLPLPASGNSTFDPAFSVVKKIEWPLQQIPPQYLLDSDFLLYQQPDSWCILLTADLPTTGDTFRVTWTDAHAVDGSTVPPSDFHAVVDYAAHLAAMQLATVYAQTSDPTIGADTVNYRTKSQEYTSLANVLRKRYFAHVGVDDSGNAGANSSGVAPAIAIGNQHNIMGSGVDRLIHNRYTR